MVFVNNNGSWMPLANAKVKDGGLLRTIKSSDSFFWNNAKYKIGISDSTAVITKTSGEVEYVNVGTLIESEAFANRLDIVSIILPNSVESISSNAFSRCQNLASINFPPSLTEIGQWAFFGCLGLTSLYIPSTVKGIYFNAFSMCTGLTSVYIMMSLEGGYYVDNEMFSGCTNLTDIYCRFEKGRVDGAPWGAENATVHYNVEE